MDAGIKKIIELIKRTGDRFVVLDAESQEPFVVMHFDEYENLMGGGERSCEEIKELEKIMDEDDDDKDTEEESWNKPETLRPFRRSEEGELIEKINRDIAEWRERQQSAITEDLPEVEPEAAAEAPISAPIAPAGDIQPILEKKGEETADEKYYFEPVAG